MSIINTGVRRRLWQDAQIHDEWATTRLWEYLIQRSFRDEEFVISSQQPPYIDSPAPLRRVDLIIEHISSTTGQQSTVFIVEAKKHGAKEEDIRQCEGQAWQAANSFVIQMNYSRPVWYLTAIGTTYRIWIMDPRTEFPVYFLPGVFSLGDIDGYLDVDTHGKDLIKAFRYIQKNLVPPEKYILQASPAASSDQVMSSSPPVPEAAAAAARAPVPLREDLWILVTITHNDGLRVFGRVDNNEFESRSEDWQLRYKQDKSLCYTYIQPGTQKVYWAPRLDSDVLLAHQNPISEEQPPDKGSWTRSVPLQDRSSPVAEDSGSYSHTDRGEGSSSMPTEPRKANWVEVKITVIPHSTSKDEWVFKDVRGSQKKVPRNEWEHTSVNGKGAWFWKRGHHYYYSHQKLRNT